MNNVQNVVNNLCAEFMDGDDLTKEFIASSLLYAANKNNNIKINDSIYQDILKVIKLKEEKIRKNTLINYASILVTTVVIFLLLTYLVKLDFILSILLSLFYLFMDFFALYKTNDRKIEKKFQKLYSRNVSSKIMQKVRELIEEVNNNDN